jgi:hypothetical protein
MHLSLRISTLPVATVAGIAEQCFPGSPLGTDGHFFQNFLDEPLNSPAYVVCTYGTPLGNPLAYKVCFMRL